MKKIYSVIMIIGYVLLTSNIFAETRMIYTINQKSANSFQVILKWNDEKKNDTIQITSYKKLDSNTFEVNYCLNNEIKKDKITIETENMSIPTIVLKEEEKKESITFKDMPKEEKYKTAINHLYSMGIINGYQDNTIKIENYISREEISAMVVRAKQIAVLKNVPSKFKDVKETDWSKDYIMTLENKNIIKGKSVNTFDPKANITIGEFCAIIDRSFKFLNTKESNYTYINKDHWSNEYIKKLTNAKVITEEDDFYIKFNPDKKATRGECALMLSRALLQLKAEN